MCCRVLQCVAGCHTSPESNLSTRRRTDSVLKCVAACCSVLLLQCVARHSTLTLCCSSVLQQRVAAACCSVLHVTRLSLCVAAACCSSVLQQHVAVCCTSLDSHSSTCHYNKHGVAAASCSSVLRCVAPHFFHCTNLIQTKTKPRMYATQKGILSSGK